MHIRLGGCHDQTGQHDGLMAMVGGCDTLPVSFTHRKGELKCPCRPPLHVPVASVPLLVAKSQPRHQPMRRLMLMVTWICRWSSL